MNFSSLLTISISFLSFPNSIYVFQGMESNHNFLLRIKEKKFLYFMHTTFCQVPILKKTQKNAASKTYAYKEKYASLQTFQF